MWDITMFGVASILRPEDNLQMLLEGQSCSEQL